MDLRALGCHQPRGVEAEDRRQLRQVQVRKPLFQVIQYVAQVGDDPACLDLDEHIGGTRYWDVYLVDAEGLADRVHPRGAHRLGHRTSCGSRWSMCRRRSYFPRR